MFRESRSFMLALGAMCLLHACTAPQPTVVSAGSIPTSGSFAYVDPGADDALLDGVGRSLEGLGLSRSDTPDYLVEVTHSARPASVGLLVPGAGDPQWHHAPLRKARRRIVETVVLTLSESRSGREIYRAQAISRSSMPGDRESLLPELLIPSGPSSAS